MYKIKVKNINGKNTGISKFIIDGEIVEEKEVELIDNGNVYNIEIFM